jgi:hypothetical protein
LTCTHRHPKLIGLVLEPHSIPLPPVIENTVPPLLDGGLESLTAPAEYIPHILLSEPSVQFLKITSSGAASTRDALTLALDAIALLPGTHTLSLVMYFAEKSVFPWDAPTVSKMIPLLRVTQLTLFTGRITVEVALLARWLAARFPELAHLRLPETLMELQTGLEEGIQAMQPADASLMVAFGPP